MSADNGSARKDSSTERAGTRPCLPAASTTMFASLPTSRSLGGARARSGGTSRCMVESADDVTMTFGGNATMLLRIGALHAAHRSELPAPRAAGPPGLRPARQAADRARAAAHPAAAARRDPAVAHARRPLGPHRHEVAAQGDPGGHHARGREVPGRPRVHGTADLRPGRPTSSRRGTDTLRITSVPGVHGPGPLARVLPQVMGSVARADPRRGGRGGRHLARLHQRRHALPAVPRRGAGAVRAARRPDPAPGRHEGRSGSP